MALTLTESRKRYTDPLARGVVETILETNPILDRLPFETIAGNAFKYNEEATLPGVEFRAINAGYTESTGTINPKTESLVILGGFSDTDPKLQEWTASAGGGDLQASNLAAKTKAASIKFSDTFFNGDTAVDANSFDGLKKRLTGAQVVAAGASGLAVVGADDAARHTFLDVLDAFLALVPNANALYMNDLILGKLRSSARRLGINLDTAEQFGRQITSYNGLPLLDAGTKADGTRILPQTETQGASSVTSSIYAVRFGNGVGDGFNVSGIQGGPLQALNLGVVNLDTKRVNRIWVEWDPGIMVVGARGAARLTGVLNA